MALQYLSRALADLNHKNASYVTFARGIGSTITFTVPADATSSQKILILLTGDEGSDTRDYNLNQPPGAPSSLR